MPEETIDLGNNPTGTPPTSDQKSQIRDVLGLEIGVDVQAYDADLTALAALTYASDKGVYWTGAASPATYTLTSFGRSLSGVANAAAGATALGLGTTDAVTFLDATAAAFKRTSSGVVTVTSTGNFANSDNGKLSNVTATSVVTRTMVAGLTAGFCTEIANSTTGSGALLLAASGVTLNGGTTSIRVERGCKAIIEYVATNAYTVHIVAQSSPRFDLANMIPVPLIWGTATASANTTNTHNYLIWAAGLTTSAVSGNNVLFPVADVPISRPGGGSNIRLLNSRFSVMTELYGNGMSNSEIRLLIGVDVATTDLVAGTAGLGLVILTTSTAKLQISDGTTLTESSPFSIGNLDTGSLNRFLLTWDGETGVLSLYQQNWSAAARPGRFALKGSVTATPTNYGSGDSAQVILAATGTPAFNISLRQRGTYWFNDIVTP